MELYYYQDGEIPWSGQCRPSGACPNRRDRSRDVYQARRQENPSAERERLGFPLAPDSCLRSGSRARESRTVFLPGGGVREVEVREEPEPVPESVLRLRRLSCSKRRPAS